MSLTRGGRPKEKKMPHDHENCTVHEIKDYITLALPFMEALARKTTNKADDVIVAVLKVVSQNEEICQKVCEALGHTH